MEEYIMRAFTTYAEQKEKRLCKTCQKNRTCDHYLKRHTIQSCEDYNPYDGVVPCPICKNYYVIGRDLRCQICGALTLNPQYWRKLYAKITPEGRILKISKSRPAGGTKEPEESYSKIILGKHT